MRYTLDQIAEQMTLVTDATAHLKGHQDRLAHMIHQNAAPQKRGPKPAVKDIYGKLSEYGVEKMYEMFSAGDRDSDIAQHFEITQSAVYARRQRWNSLKRRGALG